MESMSQIGKISRKYKGSKFIERNQTIVKENQRLLNSIGQIMNGQDYNAQKR